MYLGPRSSVDDDSQVKAHILKSAFEVLHPDVDSARQHRHLDGRLISRITIKHSSQTYEYKWKTHCSPSCLFQAIDLFAVGPRVTLHTRFQLPRVSASA